MNTSILFRNQKGVALVISLMFLAILGMLGTTAYVMTSTDLKIGRNYKTSAEAFYNADGGVQYVIATIENDLKNGTTIANGTANVLPTTVGASEPFTAASPSGFNLTISNVTMVSDSPGIYSFTSTSQNPNDGSKAVIDILFRKADHDPAFDVGILAEGDIRITGSPVIDGGIHSNGSVSQSGAGTILGGISAVGSTSAHACGADCTLNPGADRIEVPLITTADFNAWRTKAQTQSPPGYYSGTCTYSDPGAGNIYFCDGNITFTNNLNTAQSDVTIIATGNITAGGSSVKNLDGKIGVKMIAGGDILFNGGGGAVLNATFWCNGDYRHNGQGTVVGAIVAGGEITRHGCFDFIQDNNTDNENLPPGNDCNVIAWSDSRP